MNAKKYLADVPIGWCPGCGNFAVRQVLARALERLDLPRHQVVLVTGIGQAGKIAHYMELNGFNGLHGRALPPAAAIKMANKSLTVIAESGGGDIYGEGGNHLLHNIRRNVDITVLVHDNLVYALTKGQASPTMDLGRTTKVQPFGAPSEPLNPVALAIALDAGFVARAFCGDLDYSAEVIAEAVRHPGFALVNLFQPCPTYNKVNTFQWYKERVYHLEDQEPSYDVTHKEDAFRKAIESDERIATGIFYRVEKPTFHDRIPVLEGDPLAWRPLRKPTEFADLLEEFT